MSVGLHGESALEDVVHVDTTVHEKNITYPTDSKLAIKIINRLNKTSPVTSTAKGNLIVGVISHEQNLHDSNTLPEILRYVEISRGKAAIGDHIYPLIAACAWNLKQWLLAIFGSFSRGGNYKFIGFLDVYALFLHSDATLTCNSTDICNRAFIFVNA